MPRKKRKALIIIPIVVVMSILAILLILLYFNTDAFKSDKVLFTKYIGQNAQNIEEIYEALTNDEYNNMLKERKYNDKIQIKINYIENIGTSSENTNNSINRLKLNIDGQSDLKNGYNYKNLTLMDQNNKAMQLEYVQKDNTYGIRFTDLVKQYILVENSNLKELFKKIGYNEENIDNIPDAIEYKNENNIFIFSDEEKEVLVNKYLSLIGDGFSEDKFLKEKNQTIIINSQNINANRYTLKITKEQLNGIYIKILEELKQDEIISNKIENLQENINKYKIIANVETNIKETFINLIDEKIKQINETNIGQDEIEISVYESNGVTNRTSIKSTEYIINLDYLLSEEKKYIRN